MKRYEVFYNDADGQHSVVVDAENFHTAKAQCPKKSKSGVPLADKIVEVGADAELTVPVEAEATGDSGTPTGAEVATAGSDAPADAESAESGDADEGAGGGSAGSAGGEVDSQGGGL